MDVRYDDTVLTCPASERHIVWAIRHKHSGYFQLSAHDARVPALWAEKALAEQERNNRLQVWEFELVPLRFEVLSVDAVPGSVGHTEEG